jgi:hypothetical protein
MTLSCLAKCQPGDVITLCYETAGGSRMSAEITPHHREFTVIRMSNYNGGYDAPKLLVPTVGSHNVRDGMHPASSRYAHISDVPKKPPQFNYEWVVHPSYNYVVKIRKKNNENH